MTTTDTYQLAVTGIGTVEITLSERGEGRPVLVLHGGGGPLTVTPWADLLAAEPGAPVRVLTPTHPGFNGTPRPASLDSVRGLAAVYDALLAELDLHDVIVVGNSIGGWITAELALLGSSRVSGYVLVDAVGIEVPGHPVADFFALTPHELAERSYFDPQTYGVDPATLPPAAREAMAGNRAAIACYAGTTMTDETLAARLGDVTAPVLVLWGEADRIGDVEFGRAYAAAIPGARFVVLAGTGHLPQLETPAQLSDAVRAFAGRAAGADAGGGRQAH